MELRHLRYFVAVAEELHFTRAAARLHIGQPPLSQQIQALEDELGVTLFARSKRRVALTDAGQHLLLRAREILAAAAGVGDEVQRVARGEVGELRIGFTTTLPLTPILPAIVQDYRRRFPHVTLRLREMYTDDQFDALRRDELDVGFVRFNGYNAPTDVQLKVLRRDPLLLIVPASHRFAGQGSVALAECRDEEFIVYPRAAGSGIKLYLRQLCARAGFEPKVAQEAGEAITQIGLVAAGLGVCVLPAPFDVIHVDGVRYVPLSDEGAYLIMAAATRQQEPAQRVIHFVDALQAAESAVAT
jgi:DNA-binding transcriptional LysR family regulator